MTDTSWTERCTGRVAVLLIHPYTDGSFGASLTCPTGYVRRNGQCIEVDRGCQPPKHPLVGPVDAATGQIAGSATDWTSTGTDPLLLQRFYVSQSSALATPARSRLGNAWRTNFDAAAVWSGDLSSTRLIHIVLPSADEVSFALRNGSWQRVLPRSCHCLSMLAPV